VWHRSRNQPVISIERFQTRAGESKSRRIVVASRSRCLCKTPRNPTASRRHNAETDYDLTPDQWEALKALRTPAAKRGSLIDSLSNNFIALRLAAKSLAMARDHTRRTQLLLRGSPRLWTWRPDSK